jgi:hypothetical protein
MLHGKEAYERMSMNSSSNPTGSERQEYRDFVNRYEQGTPPYEDIPDEEALDRYHEVTSELSEEDYRHSAREAFFKMAPEERVEFGRQLWDQSIQRGLDFPGRSTEDQVERFQDADLLARVTARAHREHPELLEEILKGGGAGLVGGVTGDGLTGGAGASGEGGMTSNPVAKAALVGIAAMAVKRGMNG